MLVELLLGKARIIVHLPLGVGGTADVEVLLLPLLKNHSGDHSKLKNSLSLSTYRSLTLLTGELSTIGAHHRQRQRIGRDEAGRALRAPEEVRVAHQRPVPQLVLPQLVHLRLDQVAEHRVKEAQVLKDQLVLVGADGRLLAEGTGNDQALALANLHRKVGLQAVATGGVRAADHRDDV